MLDFHLWRTSDIQYACLMHVCFMLNNNTGIKRFMWKEERSRIDDAHIEHRFQWAINNRIANTQHTTFLSSSTLRLENDQLDIPDEMANFGELVLVIGDHHIPNRANYIPEKFRRMLVPGKMQHIICTGNVGSKDQYNELRNLAPNLHVVAGDSECVDDSSQMSFADTRIVQVGEFRWAHRVCSNSFNVVSFPFSFIRILFA